MSVRTDVVNLNVNINGDKAKNELNQLRKRSAELKVEMSEQNRKTVEGREKWAALNTEYKATTARMAELRGQIGLTALSQKELTAELKRLQSLKNITTPQTKEFRELQEQIDAVNGRLKNVRNGTFGFKAALGNIKDEVKQFGMLAASYLGFQFLTDQTRNLIGAQKKMADENANIAKTTNLTATEVRELNKELKTLDTRTSNSRLRELAVTAGKLGIEGVANIKAFVDEANMIDVALGEDLGDGGLDKVAKMAGIYKESMTKIASGVNAIGQASAASEAYQVDFAFRLAGVAQSARIAAGDVLGYAAALEVNGQQAEMSATALNTFFIDFISKSEAFGKAAGFAKGELGKLINDRGANEGFLQWLQRLKEASPTTQAFIDKMRSLGIDGARGSNVMLVLSQNIEQVRQQQALANNEIAKGTSVVNEYNQKNENFAATVDKIAKMFNSFFTSDTINRYVTGFVEGFGKLLKVLPDVVDWVGRNIKVFASWAAVYVIHSGLLNTLIVRFIALTTGIHANTAAVALSTLATRAHVAAMLVWDLAVAAVTLNTTKLRNAWIALNVVLNLNPLTAVATVVAGLITAFAIFSSRIAGVSSEMRAQLELTRRTAMGTIEQELKIKNLVGAIRSENTSLAAKSRYLKELIALDPAYLKGLNMANIYTQEGTTILNSYIAKLKEKAQAEALSSYQVEIEKERIALLAKLADDTDKRAKIYLKGSVWQQFGDSMKTLFGQDVGSEIAATQDKLDDLDKKAEFVSKKIAENLQKGLTTKPTNSTETLTSNDLAPAKLDNKTKREIAQAENKLQKIRDEIARLKTELDAITADAGSDAKDQQEVAKVINKYQRLLAEAKGYIYELAELTALEQRELDALFQKQFKDRSNREYGESLRLMEDHFKQRKQIAQQDYLNGLTSKKQYTQALKALDTEEAQARLQIAQDYAATSTAAFADTEKLKTDALAVAIAEREQLAQDAAQRQMDSADADLRGTRPGSYNELEAQLKILQLKHDQEIANTELTEEQKNNIIARYNEQRAQMQVRYFANEANRYIGYLQGIAQIFSTFADAKTEKENAELQEDRQRSEDKKKAFKQQLDGKHISLAVYNREVNKMDADMDARDREYKKKQAKRAKAVAILNAILSTAQGVARAFADYSWPYNLIVAAIVGGLGAAQIAKASNAKENIGRKGLIIPGPSHEDGGVDLVERRTGRQLANVEGGEPLWVFSKDTYRNNKDILDELIYNSQNRNGARIAAASWYQTPAPAINTSRIIPLMRSVGVVGNSPGNVADMSETNKLLALIIQHTSATAVEVATMKTRLKAVVEYRDLQDKEDLLKKAKAVAGINQAA